MNTTSTPQSQAYERSFKIQQQLADGNKRFLEGTNAQQDHAAKRTALSQGQNPFAIVLGCSDSRVPAEFVFDQGFGDLFVIRVAGNIATLPQIGSIEFALEQFNCPLLIVLGHSSCGAILASIEAGETQASLTEGLQSIVEQIQPTLSKLDQPEGETAQEFVAKACTANVYASLDQLYKQSPIIRKRVQEKAVRLVGAEYNLASGEVAFLKEPQLSSDS